MITHSARFTQIFLVAVVGVGCSLAQAPRDEDAKCQRDTYADKEKVLMDSWNYEQLLPGSSNDGTGNAVWSEASCDGNDQINATFPTNVSTESEILLSIPKRQSTV